MSMTTGFDAGPPVQRRSLHDDLVERLRDMIIAGTLPPGAAASRSGEHHAVAQRGG